MNVAQWQFCRGVLAFDFVLCLLEVHTIHWYIHYNIYLPVGHRQLRPRTTCSVGHLYSHNERGSAHAHRSPCLCVFEDVRANAAFCVYRMVFWGTGLDRPLFGSSQGSGSFLHTQTHTQKIKPAQRESSSSYVHTNIPRDRVPRSAGVVRQNCLV